MEVTEDCNIFVEIRCFCMAISFINAHILQFTRPRGMQGSVNWIRLINGSMCSD